MNMIRKEEPIHSRMNTIVISENEMTFLKLAATDLTYKEIARQMEVSPRTIDNYRDALFLQLNVKSRVGLVLYAIKNAVIPPGY
jgi:DNA-binding CsgD family transcriptional regulator